MAEVEHVLEIRNVIGEGPVWHSQEGFLYWVNFIEQYQILRFSPQTRRLEVFETGMPVMALGIRKAGGFIAATAKGLANWDTQRKTLSRSAILLPDGQGFVSTMRLQTARAGFGWAL
jgi:sugar lactone lactonase YvrE